jgi:hypothetical protein
MDTLDISQNTIFNTTTPSTTPITCGCKALYTYANSTEFKTLIDEHFSGNEQRRNQWSAPRRSWVLEFAKTPSLLANFDAFFTRQLGKKQTFNWTWVTTIDGQPTGGNGQTYLVRFDTDKPEYQIMELGYSTFKIPIIQVFS